jgi:hypothetical protein
MSASAYRCLPPGRGYGDGDLSRADTRRVLRPWRGADRRVGGVLHRAREKIRPRSPGCPAWRDLGPSDGQAWIRRVDLRVTFPGRSGEWRNWQTRRIQVPVSERMWGFKSPLAHCGVPTKLTGSHQQNPLHKGLAGGSGGKSGPHMPGSDVGSRRRTPSPPSNSARTGTRTRLNHQAGRSALLR